MVAYTILAAFKVKSTMQFPQKSKHRIGRGANHALFQSEVSQGSIAKCHPF